MIKIVTEIVVCLIPGDAINRVTGLPLPGPPFAQIRNPSVPSTAVVMLSV